MAVPESHKAWARYLRAHAFGPEGQPSVRRYYNEDESHSVDIFESRDDKGGVLVATIGVMDTNVAPDPGNSVFTEILMDARGETAQIGNIASMIGLYIMKDGWLPAPGVVFEDMISICEPGLAVKHVLFTPPFQWPDNVLTRVDLGDRTIYPLLAVPITDSERDFVYAHGANELESCWENWDTDVLEWNRPSSV